MIRDLSFPQWSTAHHRQGRGGLAVMNEKILLKELIRPQKTAQEPNLAPIRSGCKRRGRGMASEVRRLRAHRIHPCAMQSRIAR